MSTPLISVIITAYNAERFISETIESILSQSYSNFEIIIINDGSDDETERIINLFNDSRIVYYNPGRIGRGKALNMALFKAKGTFVAVQDADDVSHPQRLETQIQLLENYSGKVVLGTAVKRISADDIINPSFFSKKKIDSIQLIDVTSQIAFINPVKHSSAFMRLADIKKNNCYDQERKNLFDWDLFYRFVRSGGRLCVISEKLVYKRQHNNQFFEVGKRFEYIISTILLQYRIMKEMKVARISILLLPVQFIYRMLPLKIRMTVRRILGK